MMKFRQIRESVIPKSERFANKSPSALQTSKIPNDYQLFSQQENSLSFKSIKQTCSPLSNKKAQHNFNDRFKTYDSDKKMFKTQICYDQGFKSDSKQNDPKYIYFNAGPSFGHLPGKKLEFGAPKKKINRLQSSTLFDQQTSETSKTISNNLSFKTLLSKNKPGPESERKDDRQSSISKLKTKLFGMKKIISQKQSRPSQDLSSIYTKRQDKKEKPQQQPSETKVQKKKQIRQSHADLVKVSIESKQSLFELNMLPFI